MHKQVRGPARLGKGDLRKVKVIHVSTIGSTAAVLLRPQCEYLRALGYDVEFVFSPDQGHSTGGGGAKHTLEAAGFQVTEIPISRDISAADAVSVARLAAYFRQAKPDVVHTHTSKAGVVGRLAARLAGVPHVIHTVHGFPFAEGQNKAKYAAYVAIERWAARLADILLSQSKEDVETARALGIRSRKGYPLYIGNGIDLRRFDPERFKDQREELRRGLVLSSSPVISIVARLTFEKGYGELVKALAQLADLEWNALFIGADEGAGPWIRNALAESGLEGRVRLLGERSDVEQLLSISDVYVLPSYREGVPRSVIEAQAMRVPAVVTDVRGCREVVSDGVTGLLVPPKDPNALALALRRLLLEPALRRQLGEQARRRMELEFDEERVFERIAAAYESVLNAG
ncbi:MAG: glycosyltransferase family 4 protein [Limnochordaceae bacterium]|nr:glycosyltransferase family 4 protein [Limnochordaceae bacterium]